MDDINPFQNKGAALDSMTCITQTYSRSEAPLAVARAFLPLETPAIRKHAPRREIRSFASTSDQVESGLQTIGVTSVGGSCSHIKQRDCSTIAMGKSEDPASLSEGPALVFGFFAWL
jgi:hypothetical protein